MRHDITVGEGAAARRIAVDRRDGRGPPVVWLGGFRSDMTGTKAEALDAWAAETGRAFVRFDYSGHGASGGGFEDGTISRWLADTLAVLAATGARRPVLVGSSMGGWLALLATRELRSRGPGVAPSGLVLLAPATDFTERLMWDEFPADAKAMILRKGMYLQPSEYSEEPYPITLALIEDGRRHLLLDGTIEAGCPVHVLQGMQDSDVPWEHAMRLVEQMPGDSVQVTLINDGDHRLSRPVDLVRLIAAVESAATAEPAPAPVS